LGLNVTPVRLGGTCNGGKTGAARSASFTTHLHSIIIDFEPSRSPDPPQMAEAPLPAGLARSRNAVRSQETTPAASKRRSLVHMEMEERDGKRYCKHCKAPPLSASNATHSKSHLLSSRCNFLNSAAARNWAEKDRDVKNALQAKCVCDPLQQHLRSQPCARTYACAHHCNAIAAPCAQDQGVKVTDDIGWQRTGRLHERRSVLHSWRSQGVPQVHACGAQQHGGPDRQHAVQDQHAAVVGGAPRGGARVPPDRALAAAALALPVGERPAGEGVQRCARQGGGVAGAAAVLLGEHGPVV
jgi:hypothetical protein